MFMISNSEFRLNLGLRRNVGGPSSCAVFRYDRVDCVNKACSIESLHTKVV